MKGGSHKGRAGGANTPRPGNPAGYVRKVVNTASGRGPAAGGTYEGKRRR